MTIEELRAHIGCLIHINHELYWVRDDRWDGVTERFCILLAIGLEAELPAALTPPQAASAWKSNVGLDHYLQLLIDDKPQWVMLSTEFFEIVK